MSRPRSIAARFVQAAYFEIGSIVTYGKYKNHRGKLKSFGKDKWGNPTVTIEPIPKGRKQDKTLGLFRIWRADVKEKAMKELEKEKKESSMNAKTVVARFLAASGIPLGKTFNFDSVRIHRYRDHFKVTDITNAGKRGKKCRAMTIGVVGYYYKGDPEAWMENMSKVLVDYKSYDKVKNLVKDLQEQFPHEIELNEYEERGVDVEPTGDKITIKSKGTDGSVLEVEAKSTEFRVLSKAPLTHSKTGDAIGFQDTNYYSRDKAGAGSFYVWLQTNLSKVNSMTIGDLRSLWNDMDVKYDYH